MHIAQKNLVKQINKMPINVRTTTYIIFDVYSTLNRYMHPAACLKRDQLIPVVGAKLIQVWSRGGLLGLNGTAHPMGGMGRYHYDYEVRN